jgi:hypothetical protein
MVVGFSYIYIYAFIVEQMQKNTFFEWNFIQIILYLIGVYKYHSS